MSRAAFSEPQARLLSERVAALLRTLLREAVLRQPEAHAATIKRLPS